MNLLPFIQAVAKSNAPVPMFIPLDLETTVVKRGDDLDPMPYGPNPAKIFAGQLGMHQWYGHAQIPTMPGHIGMPVICGHNLKFDLQHLPHIPETPLWDTMVAEYLLTGQRVKSIGLAALAVRYGLKPKADLIGTNLAKGITPDQIPEAELRDYLSYDIALVEMIAKQQFLTAQRSGRVALILVQGEALKAYAVAEKNGLRLDVPTACKARDHHWKQAAAAIEGIRKMALHAGISIPGTVPNEELIKPRMLSLLFFSVPSRIDLVVPAPAGTALKKRQKNIKLSVTALTGALCDAVAMQVPTTEHGWYSVDESVLHKVNANGGPLSSALAARVLSYREHSKLAHTYYQPLLEYAQVYGDGLVHGTIHPAVTDTGRTSSAKPNMQNYPHAVRRVLEPGGVIEVDFKQLEMCALAHLSGDVALIEAINKGVDIHYRTGQRVFKYKNKSSETAELRRVIKSINFGLAYGGGPTTLAEQAGVSVAVARDAIKAFYTEFPHTKMYNDEYFDRVCDVPEAAWVESRVGGTVRVHQMGSVTGRRYVYEEQPTPAWLQEKTGALLAFTPTQTKNYPIQGFATGDIVPLALACLPQHWRDRLVAVVHDSAVFRGGDPLEDVTQLVAAMTTTTMVALEVLWGIKLKVPLQVEVKTGPNWGELTQVS